jgi:IS5 family transposase
MLRLEGGQMESLWDELLPEKLRELPQDLAQIDLLLWGEGLLSPIEAHWQREAEARGRSARGHGRPTIPMQTYVRLMVLKHRYGWGYETLLREVSDSLHLRRFCLIPLEQELPDESTVRKLTRRLGAETVVGLIRLLLAKAARETRFGRGRCGSTRRWWRRMCATRPTRAWRRLGARTLARQRLAARLRRPRRGCATARADSRNGRARSGGRCVGGRTTRRQRCWP